MVSMISPKTYSMILPLYLFTFYHIWGIDLFGLQRKSSPLTHTFPLVFDVLMNYAVDRLKLAPFNQSLCPLKPL